MIPWGTVVSIASKVYEQAKTASSNKAQSALLVKRVKTLLSFVEIKNKIDSNPSEGTGPEFEHSDALHQTLKNALELLGKFQGKGAFLHFAGAQGWKKGLEGVNKRLDQDAQSFGIAAQMQGLVKQNEYHKALMADVRDLKSAMISLLKTGEKTEENTKIIIESLEFTKTSFDELLSSQQGLSVDHAEIKSQLDKLSTAVKALKNADVSSGVRRAKIRILAPGAKVVGNVKVTHAQIARKVKVPEGIDPQSVQAMLGLAGKVFFVDAQSDAEKLESADVDVISERVEVGGDIDTFVIKLLAEFEITPRSHELRLQSEGMMGNASSQFVSSGHAQRNEVMAESAEMPGPPTYV